MKNLILIAILFITLSSCEKEGHFDECKCGKNVGSTILYDTIVEWNGFLYDTVITEQFIMEFENDCTHNIDSVYWNTQQYLDFTYSNYSSKPMKCFDQQW
jgi:hypothetical protein